MADAQAVKEWTAVRETWYEIYNELAAAISKVGGLGSAQEPSLNAVRIADQKAEDALVVILKRTSPTYQKLEGKPGIMSPEYTLAVGVYQYIMRLRDLCSQQPPDLTEALDQVSLGMKQINLAFKYVS